MIFSRQRKRTRETDTTTNKIARTLTLTGNIEGISNGILAGWFFDSDDDIPQNIELLFDGDVLQTNTTSLLRNDVYNTFGHGLKSGFTFDLTTLPDNLPDNLVFRINAVKANRRFDFNGTAISCYRPVLNNINTLKKLFSPEFYRCRNEFYQMSAKEAFDHYMNFGIFDNLDPCPYYQHNHLLKYHKNKLESDAPSIISYLKNEQSLEINPSIFFDVKFYAQNNPDLAAVDSLLAHYVKHGSAEGRTPTHCELPSNIIDEIDEIIKIEPAIISAVSNLKQIVKYPHIIRTTYFPILIKQRFGDQIKVIICVPFINRGGADLISTFLLKAYQESFGKDSVLLIVTDHTGIEIKEWIDNDTLHFCMDEECEFIDYDDKIEALHNTVGLLAPEILVNVNSHLCWDFIQRYGLQLSSSLRMYAYLFCFDYDDHGRKVGYIPGYVPAVVNHMTGLFCDNQTVINEMRSIYGFDDLTVKKFHTVYVPYPDELKSRQLENGSDPEKILWIGRMARQKRPDILVKVAQLVPRYRFDVYGSEGDSTYSRNIVNGEYQNINYLGVYSELSEIDFSEYSIFLNTSQWDGLPTILIQMMRVGLPIVTSNVGGITELVNNQTGFLVSDIENPESYVQHMYKIFMQADITAKKVKRGQQLISERHTWEAFVSRLRSIGAFTSKCDDVNQSVVDLSSRRCNNDSGEIDNESVCIGSAENSNNSVLATIPRKSAVNG